MTKPGKPHDDNMHAAEAKRRRDAAVEAFAGKANSGHPFSVKTRHGEVSFGSVEAADDKAIGATWLEIRLAGQSEGGDPHFRIFNPPVNVEDPEGPIVVNGKHYRNDPVAAVAEAIALSGGRTAQKGIRR